MSWAAHNPEIYDKILKSGVVRKLTKELTDYGFKGRDRDTLVAIVDVMAEDSKVYDALIWWSRQEGTEAEREYFAGLVDDAMNSHD